MDRIVYFADKAVIFTAQPPAGACLCVASDDAGGITRDKVLKILETHNCAAVLSADPEAAFAAFAAQFTQVVAAGGVVVDARGRALMIRRNGRWDLPKGHLECGEELPTCAVREIAEETGICAEAVRPLCETLHAYYFPPTARWEMKRTHWFLLRATVCEGLKPQREEGIESVAWCTPDEVARNLREAFPTIRCVAAAMRDGRSECPEQHP